jgi:hypothetical protein
MMAFDVLCTTVPLELTFVIANKDIVKEAWDAIATFRVGDGHVKKNTTQQLHREFELAAFKDDEFVEDFMLRLNGMVAQLTMLDNPIEEAKVVEKILRSMPTQFKQIIIAIRHIHTAAQWQVVLDGGKVGCSTVAAQERLWIVVIF